MVKPARVSRWLAKRDFLFGQNSTIIGSSDTDDTAFAVIATTSSPAGAHTTATPVANNPMVSRNWRGSGGGDAGRSLIPRIMRYERFPCRAACYKELTPALRGRECGSVERPGSVSASRKGKTLPYARLRISKGSP